MIFCVFFFYILGGFFYLMINDKDLFDFLLDGNCMKKLDNCLDEM